MVGFGLQGSNIPPTKVKHLIRFVYDNEYENKVKNEARMEHIAYANIPNAISSKSAVAIARLVAIDKDILN